MPKKPPKKTDLSHIHADLRPLAVPIADLALDPRNARKHDAAGVAAIAAAIRQYGQRTPLVVQREGNIVRKGNGSLLAARDLGYTHLAALIVDEDDRAATGYAITDNRTAELSAWDPARLEELLAELNLASDDFVASDLGTMLADLDAWAAETLAAGSAAAEQGTGEATRNVEAEPPVGDDKTPREKGAKQIKDTFQVLVTCADEDQQAALLEEFTGRGLKVRALTV